MEIEGVTGGNSSEGGLMNEKTRAKGNCFRRNSKAYNSLALFVLIYFVFTIPPELIARNPSTYAFAAEISFTPSSNPFQTNDQNILLFSDTFETTPYGFDQRIWTELPNSNGTSWEDNEYLVLQGDPFSFTGIQSKLELNPDVYVIGPGSPTVSNANGLIADFEFTFTCGNTYFGIGWVDTSSFSIDNWTGNFRCATNGIYLDYWDGGIHMVACSQGKRTVLVIPELSLYETHNFRLIWRDSIVILLIDGEIECCISDNIPMECMPFVISSAEFDDRVGIDEFKLCEVTMLTFGYLDYPESALPILLWPQNGSHILENSWLSFEIYGGSEKLQYSWDYRGWYERSEPWDIRVPDEQGEHILQIEVENYNGDVTKQCYCFYTEHQVSHYDVYELTESPEINGIIESWERDAASENNMLFLREDGAADPAMMSIGFLNNSIYLGLETQIPDGLYTSISMFIDADGSGIWGDTTQGSILDYQINVGAPSALDNNEGVVFCDGTNSSFQDNNINTSVGTRNGMISLETLIATDTLLEETAQFCFSITIKQGGVSSFYPVNILSETPQVLASVKNLGVKPLNSSFIPALMIGLGILTTGIISKVYRKSKKGLHLMSATLQEEALERVRTLVLSYPRAKLEKLRRMSGLQETEFESALLQLIQDHLVDVEITPDGEMIRGFNKQSRRVSGI